MRRLTTVGRLKLATSVLLLLMPGPAAAQSAASSAPSAPDLKKWDAAGTLGWHTRSLDRGLYSSRVSSASCGVVLGRYWTENVKTEVEFTSAGTADAYYWDDSFRSVPIGPPASLHASNFQVSAAQLYQFFHNAWVHPFAGAGVVADRERYQASRPASQVPTYSYAGANTTTESVAIPAWSRNWTRWRTAPLVVAGFKAYVSHHAFFRADLRVTVRTPITTNARIGFGFDF